MIVHPRPSMFIAIGALALALSACGSPESGAQPSATAPATTAPQVTAPAAGASTDMTAFRECLLSNGVDLPEGAGFPPGPGGMPSGAPSGMPTGAPPSFGPGGPGGPMANDPAFQQAMRACADLAPQGIGPGGQPPMMDANAATAFATCMGDNGVSVLDPSSPLAGLDPADADVKAALEVCQPLLPTPGQAGAGLPSAS